MIAFVSPDLANRYHAAMHAMQSGVQWEHDNGSKDGNAKHLRVGFNSAMIETSALTRLLIAKGVIAHLDEFFEVLVQVAEEEVAKYEARLSEKLGSVVKLA